MQIYANWKCKNFLIFDACSLDLMIFNPKVTIQKFALLLVSYLKVLFNVLMSFLLIMSFYLSLPTKCYHFCFGLLERC